MRMTLAGVSGCLFLISAVPSFAQEAGWLGRMFDQLDQNHDGLVSRAEFEASRPSRFAVLDRNHDHYLSEADFPRLAVFAPPRARAMPMAIQRFDLDHDGRISEAEFVRGSMLMFDQADTNHDGFLSREEAAAASTRVRAEIGAVR